MMNATQPLQLLITILVFSLLLCVTYTLSVDHAHHTLPLTLPHPSSHDNLDCKRAFAGKGKPVYGGKAHAGLVHPHGPCSPIKEFSHLLKDMPAMAQELLRKDQERVGKLLFTRRLAQDVTGRSLATSTSTYAIGATASGQILGTGNYIMMVGIGTPSSDFVFILDTGSNLAWTQCTPCGSPTSCYQQVSPLFDPTASSSYSPISCATLTCTLCSTAGLCQYNVSYGDESNTFGDLAEETFTIGGALIQNYIFGCGRANQGSFGGADGLVGLGWSGLSLPQQTLSFFGGAFAYCLPSILASPNATGFIEFGVEAVVNTSVGSSFTPMIHNLNMPSYYFVWLKAISVEGVPLSLASTPAIPPNSTDLSGTFVDSGTVITRLPSSDYVTFRNAFLAGSTGITLISPNADSILDTCFQFDANSQIPAVTFHFDGFDLPLAVENIVIPFNLSSTNSLCLAFAPTPAISAQLLVIGNHQMAGFLFTFDTVGLQMGVYTASKAC